MKPLVTFKHISSKNADYGAAEEIGGYMKKIILYLLVLTCGLGLEGCLGESDKADISNIMEISGLVTEKGYIGEDLQDNLLGQTREDIIIAWGDPDGSLFGLFGDVWYLSDESNKQIVVYYDKDGVVEHILLEERYTDSSTDAEKRDLILMVMADDVLYLDTGYKREADKRPDTFEGIINSAVDRREKPTVNDQSNFGTGYGYRHGKSEGIIEVYMNDKWQVFATEKIIAGDTLILDEQLTEQSGNNKMWDRIPMVRVNGKLYYDTGRESTISGRCGNMDGEITLTVDGTEIPTEDNQSNFGSGFGYQYGADDIIEIYMNEKWIVFEYREKSE